MRRVVLAREALLIVALALASACVVTAEEVELKLVVKEATTGNDVALAVVDPDERSAAAGVTGIARSVGAAAAPVVSAPLVGVPALAALPFVNAGSLKIAYDLLLYRAFRSVRPPEESADPRR